MNRKVLNLVKKNIIMVSLAITCDITWQISLSLEMKELNDNNEDLFARAFNISKNYIPILSLIFWN